MFGTVKSRASEMCWGFLDTDPHLVMSRETSNHQRRVESNRLSSGCIVQGWQRFFTWVLATKHAVYPRVPHAVFQGLLGNKNKASKRLKGPLNELESWWTKQIIFQMTYVVRNQWVFSNIFSETIPRKKHICSELDWTTQIAICFHL